MTLLSFAFGAGLLATVNPCGFAILPAFLAYYLGDDSDGEGAMRLTGAAGRLANGFAVGAAVSAGFAAVFVTAGLVASAGLRSLVRYVPWAAVAIGAGLVVLGVAMLAGRHVGLAVLGDRLRPREGRSVRRMVLFGAAYAVASLSCTLAVLLAVVAQALATDNPLQMLAVFGAYSAGAATVLVALAVSASLSKAAVARGLRRLLPLAGRLGGAVLVASGAYLVAYWLPALDTSARGRPAGGFVGDLSTRATTLLDANQGAFAVAGVVLAVVGIGLVLARRRTAGEGECCSTGTGSPDGPADRGVVYSSPKPT